MSSMNNYISSANLPSDVMIKKISTEKNFRTEKYKVFLIWVPGHSGIKSNEEANTLTEEGALMSLIGPEAFCGIGECTYKKKFSRGKSWEEVRDGVIYGFQIVKCWLDKNKLTLNADKTFYMAFSMTDVNRPRFDSISINEPAETM